jgi:hypothetical protein
MVAKNVGEFWLHKHAVVPTEMSIIVNGIVVNTQVVTIGTETIMVYKRNRRKNKRKYKK